MITRDNVDIHGVTCSAPKIYPQFYSLVWINLTGGHTGAHIQHSANTNTSLHTPIRSVKYLDLSSALRVLSMARFTAGFGRRFQLFKLVEKPRNTTTNSPHGATKIEREREKERGGGGGGSGGEM